MTCPLESQQLWDADRANFQLEPGPRSRWPAAAAAAAANGWRPDELVRTDWINKRRRDKAESAGTTGVPLYFPGEWGAPPTEPSAGRSMRPVRATSIGRRRHKRRYRHSVRRPKLTIISSSSFISSRGLELLRPASSSPTPSPLSLSSLAPLSQVATLFFSHRKVIASWITWLLIRFHPQAGLIEDALSVVSQSLSCPQSRHPPHWSHIWPGFIE